MSAGDQGGVMSAVQRLESRVVQAWFAAAVLWASAAGILTVQVPEGTGFILYELVWIAAHLAVLAGLVGLGRMRPHGSSRLGEVGLKLAIGARIVFLLAEAYSLRTGAEQSVLLPVGALGTAIAMILFGTAVARQDLWHGWRRFAPLCMGIYPFLVMFPVLAVTGEPSSVAIGGWALAFIAIGAAAAQEHRYQHAAPLPGP